MDLREASRGNPLDAFWRNRRVRMNESFRKKGWTEKPRGNPIGEIHAEIKFKITEYSSDEGHSLVAKCMALGIGIFQL